MGLMASPITSRLFTQPLIQAQIKENIKAPRHWPLCGELTGDRWIPRTKGQYRGMFPFDDVIMITTARLYPYPAWLLHLHWGDPTIVSVPVTQPWIPRFIINEKNNKAWQDLVHILWDMLIQVSCHLRYQHVSWNILYTVTYLTRCQHISWTYSTKWHNSHVASMFPGTYFI